MLPPPPPQILRHPCKFHSWLQSQYEEAVQSCEVERSLFNQDMAAALHAVFEHKEHISETLQRVYGRVTDITTDARAIKV